MQKTCCRKLLVRAKHMEVLGKLTASLQVRPFEFIRKTEASQILNFIQDEHPQTIALILSYLSPQQAAGIISSLTPDKQTDVAKRIAMMDRTSPDVIKEVENILEQKLASLVSQDYTIVGGVDSVVEVSEYSRPWYRETHYGKLGNRGTGTCRRDPKKDVCVRGYSYAGRPLRFSVCLREVENSELAVALKNANEEVQNVIFNNHVHNDLLI